MPHHHHHQQHPHKETPHPAAAPQGPVPVPPRIPPSRIRRVGGWLPENRRDLVKWVNHRVRKVRNNPPTPTQVVQDFRDLVYSDPQLYMLFNEMLNEVPAKYAKDPSGRTEVQDIDTLFLLFDSLITEPPAWNNSAQIGTPINAVLDWPMGTKAGFAAFLKDNVNQHFKKMLNAWSQFLLTPASLSTLNEHWPDGWFQEAALDSPHMENFVHNFVCDPDKPYWGFTSWDNFFTRVFRTGIRPVAHPTDDSYIASACEAAPFSVQHDVQLLNTFWIKSELYSLAHMMNNDPRAQQFVGGIVYQAFLSADSYHRWHAPVSGKIVSTTLIEGTYYSEPLFAGFSPDSGVPNPDPGADEDSQGYISAVAARALIFIEADNPEIGLMCMIMVGMAEVSSIDITMPVDKHFKKGEEIGMFHFGGSTHCMIFRPDVKLKFLFPPGMVPGPDNNTQMLVCSALAKVQGKGL